MRLIDADALMTEFMDSDLDHLQRDDWREVIQIVTDAPTVNPEPHWIPVTERLPEPRIDVWCNSDLGQMVGYYDETIETWFGRDYLELLVNAWMPLPEPFKGVTT